MPGITEKFAFPTKCVVMTSESFTMDSATLERIIAAAVTTAVRAERQVTIIPPPQAPSIAVVEKAMSWVDFPKWPGKCDRVDAWFQSLEAKFKAARIKEDKWASKLMECPKIGDELKRRLAGLEDPSYEGVRKHCLETYGPVDPVGFFRSQIYSVKGSTREEVLEKLEDARALHNRAARMVGRHEWEDSDLLYPFVNAFPEAVATKLRQEMASASRNGSPLQELVSKAPSVGDAVAEEDKELPLVGQVQGEVQTSKKRKAPQDDPLVAEIRELRKALKTSTATNGSRPAAPFPTSRRQCSNCGGMCAGSTACPAQGRTCHNCGRMGHLRRVCRAPPGRNQRSNPQQPPFMRGQDRN